MKTATRSASQGSAPNYNQDAGDSDFEDMLGSGSARASPVNNKPRKLKRKRDSDSSELSERTRRASTRSTVQYNHDTNADRNGVPEQLVQSKPRNSSGTVVLKLKNFKKAKDDAGIEQRSPSPPKSEAIPAVPSVEDELQGSAPEDQVSPDRSQNADSVNGHDEDDEDYEAARPRRSSRKSKVEFTQDNEDISTSRRPHGSRLSSRHSAAISTTKQNSDEEDYDPSVGSAGDSNISTASDTPEPDNLDDFIVRDGPRKTNRSRSLRTNGSKRRSGRPRVIESEDEAGEVDSIYEVQAELEDLRPPAREERRRQLRDRTNRPDYAIPPPLTDQMLPESVSRKRDDPFRRFRSLYPEFSSLGLGLPSTAQQTFGNFGPSLGLPSDTDSSDDDNQLMSAENRVLGSALAPQVSKADQAIGGGPKNMGKVKGANTADADPITIDKEVNFQSVGGLADHISQLKEMVSLPLLYPEIFQRFHISPPRGVLFHGPPGTGKTLMARALAASCSSESRKISFYMRKGADCLSKWVGEAERQLRLLFEEAKNNQPSIIFFDEIDGLAPVRSAKQDQIHASIVSTLLALMDGMDSRGQVVVIGATNRPDSVDPALRRPGRFDREFYFPLPELGARQHILNIHTARWDPPLSADFISDLAKQTKGYGGADLRALCTEAALYAVQRRYPQIYSSSEKLVIDPTTIKTSPKDFMMAIKKIVPSSARSNVSQASSLPPHMYPLLARQLAHAIQVIDSLLPRAKTKSVLEESLYIADDNSTFETENMRQLLESLRTYRPRLLISGPDGSGQDYLGRAILQHLEGYHVRTIDLAAMFGDSTSTAEAVLIQAFSEARRHPPAVLYMPSVDLWFQIASDTVILTLKSLLASIGTNEQMAVIGTTNQTLQDLTPRLRELFGQSAANNISLSPPNQKDRLSFFFFLVSMISKSPADLPDATTKRKRVLETLAVAPPLPPREPTKAERKAIELKDRKTKLLLKAKLGTLMELIRSRYKRFKKPAIDEKDISYLFDDSQETDAALGDRDFEKAEDGMILEKATGKKYYNMDLDLIDQRLWRSLYLTPKQFQHDIEQIAHDAGQIEGDRERGLKAQELLTSVQIHLEDMFDSQFLDECKRMAMREVTRYRQYLESRPVAAKTNDAVIPDAPLTVNLEAIEHSSEANGLVADTNGTNAEEERAKEDAEVEALVFAVTNETTVLENGEHGTPVPVFGFEQPMNGHGVMPIAERLLNGAVQPIADPRNTSSTLNENLHGHIRKSNSMSLESILISDEPETQMDIANNHNFPLQEEMIEHQPLELDREQLDRLQHAWTSLTNGLNISQIEQVNSAAIDIVWRMRSDWNRDRVAAAVNSGIEHIVAELKMN